MAVSDAPRRTPGRGLFSSGLFTELVKFGLVGGVAFVVDLGVYNLLRFTFLEDKPIGAKIISVAVATIVSWLGSRYWTFSKGKNESAFKEFASFAIINVGGLAVASLCLYVSHYILGFDSKLADNLSGNGVGLVLGTAFRYAMYRFVLFRPGGAFDDDEDLAETAPASRTPSPADPALPLGTDLPAEASSPAEDAIIREYDAELDPARRHGDVQPT